MKKLLILVVMILAGIGVGGGAAFATMLVVGPRGAASAHAAEQVPPTFVDAGKILAPLVFADGRLSSYVEFTMQLEVPEDKKDFVAARLPMLLHAINMRTYRTPLAAGPDGLLPDIEAFRKVVEASAPEAFGKDVVRKVAVTQAMPA